MMGYTGSQEAAEWSLSGARGSGMGSSGQRVATHDYEGLYNNIMIYYHTVCQLTLLNGTLLVVWSHWVLVPRVISSAT